MAGLARSIIAGKQFTAKQPAPTARNIGRADGKYG